MSFTPEQFHKVTGVAPDAGTDALVKATAKKVKATVESECATALLLARLVDGYGWQKAEGAKHVGLSSSQAGILADRGRIVETVGYERMVEVWLCVRSMGDNTALTALHADIITLPESERADEVIRQAVRKVVGTRLGDSAKPADIDALTAGIVHAGGRTPVAARNLLPTVAKAIEVALPTGKRKASQDGGSTPTMVNALDTARNIIAQRLASPDGAIFTPTELAAIDSMRTVLARVEEEGRVSA